MVPDALTEHPEVIGLLARGEERGCVTESQLESVARDLELGDDEDIEGADQASHRIGSESSP